MDKAVICHIIHLDNQIFLRYLTLEGEVVLNGGVTSTWDKVGVGKVDGHFVKEATSCLINDVLATDNLKTGRLGITLDGEAECHHVHSNLAGEQSQLILVNPKQDDA